MGKSVPTQNFGVGLRRLSTNLPRTQGFTLVELVMVILLLGIMATFSSQFIGIGTQIYGDASSRELLMSDARFAMERLNRELRDAVPGSERIETKDEIWVDSGPCLRFWSISSVSRYLDINRSVSGNNGLLEAVIVTPVASSDPLTQDANAVRIGDWIVLFPVPDKRTGALTAGCEYGNCLARVSEVLAPVAGVQTIRYASSSLLAGLSPGNRIYFARQRVRYCVEGDTITRISGQIATQIPAVGVLMADSLRSGLFYRETSAFNAEGEFGMRFVFERNGESVTFNHKIGVFNVP